MSRHEQSLYRENSVSVYQNVFVQTRGHLFLKKKEKDTMYKRYLIKTSCIAQELYSVLCNNLYGKRFYKRVDMCICITRFFAVHLKVIHCKSTIPQ